MAQRTARYRFPFVGEGVAAARKERRVVLVFAKAPRVRDRATLSDGAPRVFNVEEWRTPRVLEVGHVGELQWAVARDYRPRGDRWEDGEATTAQWKAHARELERWLRAVHARCALALVVAPDDDEYGTSFGAWHRWSSLDAGPAGVWMALEGAARDSAADRRARAFLRALLSGVLARYRSDLALLGEEEQRAKLSAIVAPCRELLARNGGVPEVVKPAAKDEGPSLDVRLRVWAKDRGRDGDRELRFRDALGHDASLFDLVHDLVHAGRYDDAVDVCLDALEGTVEYPDHYLDELMFSLVRAERWAEARARLPEALCTVPLYSADGTMVAWVSMLEHEARAEDASAVFAGAVKYGTYFRTIAEGRGLEVERYGRPTAALLRRFGSLFEAAVLPSLTRDRFSLEGLAHDAWWRIFKNASDVGAAAVVAQCEAARERRERSKQSRQSRATGGSPANDAPVAAWLKKANSDYAALAKLGAPADVSLRERWLTSLNNGAVMTWRRRDFDLSRRLVEAAGEHAAEYPAIFHAAACTYVSLGELDKAMEQVVLAAKHAYEGLANMRNDADLKPIRNREAFRAIFDAKRRR